MMQIREAEAGDVHAIFGLITELALFEKAPEQVINTPEQLLRDGFGKHPLYICFVAEENGVVCAMSFCYTRYSTWKGACLYLEDLIVTESMRGRGIGKALFLHTLAYARSKGMQRVQWQVLDWNTPAIEFYKSLDARLDAEWLNAWVDLPDQG